MKWEQQIKTEISLPRDITAIFKLEEKEIPSFIKKTLALELFRERKISLGKAAQIADLSKEEMMVLLTTKKSLCTILPKILEKMLQHDCCF